MGDIEINAWFSLFLNLETNLIFYLNPEKLTKFNQSQSGIRSRERNWVFVTSSIFLKLISLQPASVNLWYFKLRFFEITKFIVWNIRSLQHHVRKILELKNQNLLQEFNSLKFFAPFRINIQKQEGFSNFEKPVINLSKLYPKKEWIKQNNKSVHIGYSD